MIITEVTHHGQFREERTIEVESITTTAMADILAGCPYTYNSDKAADLAVELFRTGRTDWGWTTWTVVGGSTNVINLPTGGNA